jgi:hypothetical protein
MNESKISKFLQQYSEPIKSYARESREGDRAICEFSSINALLVNMDKCHMFLY